MKKKLTLLLASIMLLSSQVYASDIYYRGEYIVSNRFSIKPAFNTGEGTNIVSNRFSIKPAFNTGEGKLVVSNRFSIKPAFNSGRTQYFYSGVISIMEMPDALFMTDGVAITEKTKVKDTSKLSFSIDYGETTHSAIESIKYYVKNISDTTEFVSDAITLVGNKAESDIANTLVRGKKYEIGQVTKFADGFSYETKSVPFIVNEKGVVEFLKPTGNMLFSNTVTMRFESKQSETLTTYNVYLEYNDGTRLLVGGKVKATETFVSNTEDGYSVHEFKHKLDDTSKKFKYVIEFVD